MSLYCILSCAVLMIWTNSALRPSLQASLAAARDAIWVHASVQFYSLKSPEHEPHCFLVCAYRFVVGLVRVLLQRPEL
jgi:hypothetical protein